MIRAFEVRDKNVNRGIHRIHGKGKTGSNQEGRRTDALSFGVQVTPKIIPPAALRALRPFRVFREGMSFVNGAPWNTQDAVAERTERVSP